MTYPVKNPLKGLALLLLTVVVVVLLNIPLGSLPAIGKLLDPVNGSLANADPVDEDFTAELDLPAMKGAATVWFDDRLVPHIHAANDHDLYFIEGYVHAKFRLWQMDMETRAAAGRVAEVVGEKALQFDRKQRRKGMGYAAENSLRAMEAEPRTKLMMDAYTEGINAYIASLSYRELPIEYKLMGFRPERWTNLRSALLLKFMADDLTGRSYDIAYTYLRDVLPAWQFELLFPEKVMGSTPVIPGGTVWDSTTLATPVAPSDSLAFPRFKPADFGERHEEGKGSNNWVVSGSRTASGAPILCNDPHLGLNLPSLWYEVQLQAPGINVYGASLPGTPGVVIGFNDNISWGFTNNYRDVKDFYLIKPVTGNSNSYWFAGRHLDYSKRIEHIAIKGRPDITDTVRYTIHGPLMYDERYNDKSGMRQNLAMCWMAHRATNEMLCVYLLNRAGNYNEYVNAIMNFQCPAQNMAYADRAGNIALWGQGQYVNKWKGQGKFVMNGADSSTLWGSLIPMRENPHVFNPQQGFVSSANQSVTDTTYPYYYNGDFVELRAWRINYVLGNLQKATVQDMFALQNDNYSLLAAQALPIMLTNLPSKLTPAEQKYVNLLRSWDHLLEPGSEAATVFQVWWAVLYNELWKGVLVSVPDHIWPLQERSMQLMSDSVFMMQGLGNCAPMDNNCTRIANSFHLAADSLAKLERTVGLQWHKVKNTSVSHLTKLAPFSYDHLDIGGWGNTVNATKSDQGPSWRMVVQMGKEIEAYGVYPGGQSGNPGSKYYASFLQHWAKGKYYRLQFLPNAATQNNPSLKYTWTIHN
ncbi:MAG: penicillin acylase family protein [Bacteroidota bacterium]